MGDRRKEPLKHHFTIQGVVVIVIDLLFLFLVLSTMFPHIMQIAEPRASCSLALPAELYLMAPTPIFIILNAYYFWCQQQLNSGLHACKSCTLSYVPGDYYLILNKVFRMRDCSHCRAHTWASRFEPSLQHGRLEIALWKARWIVEQYCGISPFSPCNFIWS